MKHLTTHNEGLFNWRRNRGKEPLHRGFSKDDMYISSGIGYKKRIGTSQLKDSNTFYSIRFPDMSLNMIKQHIVSKRDIHSKGIFGDFGSYRTDGPRYREKSWVKSTSVWYDCGNIFNSLRNISDQCGYSLNQSVHVTSTQKDTKIVEIVNFSFYKLTGILSDGIDECLTLLYKVEEDDNYYQIGQIEKIEDSPERNIVDEVIEENFLELMDDGLITFKSEEIKIKGVVNYKCYVKVSKDMTPQVLFKISECLLVAAQRLNDINIDIDIKSMQHSEDRNTRTGTTDIEFTAIQS
jgi:hypothetical protein